MSNVFFTSDLHLGHEGIVAFRNKVHKQDFQSASDVDEWLLERHNARVRPQDTVWMLGDIVWGTEHLPTLEKFNGRKRIILGNHDLERGRDTIDEYMKYFETVHAIKKKYGIVMSHVPIHPESLEFRWEYNMHGHIHHKELDLKDPRYLNVNVDVNNGFPLSLHEVREALNAEELTDSV